MSSPYRSRRDGGWYDEERGRRDDRDRHHRSERHHRSRSRSRDRERDRSSRAPSVTGSVDDASTYDRGRGRHLRERESSRDSATLPPPPAPVPAATSPRSPRSPYRSRGEDLKLLQPIEKKNFSLTMLAVSSLFLAYIVVLYSVALGGDWYEVQDKVIFRAVGEEEPLATTTIRRSYSLYDFEECISFTNVDSESLDAIQAYNKLEGCNTLGYDEADASSERPRYIGDVKNATIATAVFLAAALFCVFVAWVLSVVEMVRGYGNKSLEHLSVLRSMETIFCAISAASGILATLSFFGVMEESADTDPTEDCNAEGIGRFYIPQASENAPQSCRGSQDDNSEEATTIILSAEYRPEAWLPLVGALLSFGIILLLIVRLKVHSAPQDPREQELELPPQSPSRKDDISHHYDQYHPQHSHPPYSYSRRYPDHP